MEKINITIPDNLTPEQEVLEIARNLGKKLLPTSKKFIGESYEVKQLQTQINIKRKPTEKVIVTFECSVCQTLFSKDIGRRLFTNYGGHVRERNYCSDTCRDVVLDFVGEGRAAVMKKDLKPFRLY